MRYALLDAGDELIRHGYFATQPADPVGKGWRWVEDPAPPPAPVVPAQVNNSQMREALRRAGHLAAIDAFIVGLASEEAVIAWEYGNVIHRVSPLVQAAQAALGWSDASVDALFIEASAIEF